MPTLPLRFLLLKVQSLSRLHSYLWNVSGEGSLDLWEPFNKCWVSHVWPAALTSVDTCLDYSSILVARRGYPEFINKHLSIQSIAALTWTLKNHRSLPSRQPWRILIARTVSQAMIASDSDFKFISDCRTGKVSHEKIHTKQIAHHLTVANGIDQWLVGDRCW